ncbi:MAG: hypothetical protein WBG29_16285 [Candidatus Acidiferrales bacterium]
MNKRNERGNAAVVVAWWVVGTLVAAAAITYLVGQYRVHASDEVQFTTPYQFVVFTNSVSYFGKLEGFGGPHPVLRDVYYVVTETDPQTKQPRSILVKRGKEWHEPDRMYINPNEILIVEPVNPDSKVAQLIEEMRSQK